MAELEHLPPAFRAAGMAALCLMLERELNELRGDAMTLRGYIKTYGETPSMTASHRDRLLREVERYSEQCRYLESLIPKPETTHIA